MKYRKYVLSPAVLSSVLIIAIFVLFFIMSIAYKQIQSVTDSERWVVHSKDVQIELLQLSSYLKDAETGQRGYLITHDPAFLKPYKSATEKINQSFAQLKTLTSDNSEQQQNVSALHPLINQRLDLLARVIESSGSEMSVSDSTKRKFVKGRSLMEMIHVQTDKMVAIEMELLKKREQTHEQENNFSPFILLFVTLFSLLVFIGAFYKISEDVKSLKKINNQLVVTQETFEHAEQIAEMSNWCWNLESNKLSYSDNQYRLLGCEPQEFEPTIEAFLEYVHPDDRHLIEDGGKLIMEKNIASTVYFRVIRKDKQLRYFKSVGKIIIDSYEKPILIGINADITEQHFKDEMLAEQLLDLENSNQDLSAFNHIASHDLQEPLRKIQTFISRIKETDFATLSEKGKDYFVRITNSASKMRSLIDDLLVFSQANKADKVFEIIDLDKILENSKEYLAQAIEEKNAIIQSSKLPTLNVIPFQIQQLFNNVIGNALKYSKTGVAPVIKITTEIVLGKNMPPALMVGDKEYHKISIADNGIGFEQQYAESIFKFFHRLLDDKEILGTGIGLTICKKIAENHKGFIVAEGTPNVGAVFSVFLPV